MKSLITFCLIISTFSFAQNFNSNWSNGFKISSDDGDFKLKFGGRIMWYVPKQLRAKIDVAWRYGWFLGRSMFGDQQLWHYRTEQSRELAPS